MSYSSQIGVQLWQPFSGLRHGPATHYVPASREVVPRRQAAIFSAGPRGRSLASKDHNGSSM